MSNMENDKKNYDYMADPKLSDKWKFRFKFIEDHGYPAVLVPTPAWRDALKKMSIKERLTVSLNFITYFFSFIYLAILGLWKKSIICVLAIFVVAIISDLLNMRSLIYIVPFYFACR
ncbi:DUF2628 domain-containing protein, partial [Cronobacter sakazakii]